VAQGDLQAPLAVVVDDEGEGKTKAPRPSRMSARKMANMPTVVLHKWRGPQ